jgi:hypothetical protein
VARKGLLAFLHTAASQVAVFDALLREMAPGLLGQHSVHEELLAEARHTGLTPALTRRVQEEVLTLGHEPGALVVCTCSTIGGCAEAAKQIRPGLALRIDRPMAERAVLLGEHILIAAALESTLVPTRCLLEDAARAAGRRIQTTFLLCEGAWASFERGDRERYRHAIAETLRQGALGADVVVLAQASMAGVEALCRELPVPVLSSPRLGLEGALARYRSR